MHVDSSQVRNLLNPIMGPRDAAVRAGIKPPNHAKSNIAAVKEMSSLNNMRRAAAAQQEQQQQQGGGAARRSSAPGSRPAASYPPQQMSRQPSMDSNNPSGRNFVKENKAGAAAPVRQPRPQPKGDDGLKYLHKHDFGRVPTYLLERKIENIEKQEQEMRDREAAMIPPGMRLLSEEERLETLVVLQRSRQELERAAQALPLRIETPGQIRRRDDIEQRIREVEEGLKAFSRPKVIVKL